MSEGEYSIVEGKIFLPTNLQQKLDQCDGEICFNPKKIIPFSLLIHRPSVHLLIVVDGVTKGKRYSLQEIDKRC